MRLRRDLFWINPILTGASPVQQSDCSQQSRSVATGDIVFLYVLRANAICLKGKLCLNIGSKFSIMRKRDQTMIECFSFYLTDRR